METFENIKETFRQVEFASDLYRQLNIENSDKNLVFSPLSVYIALSMIQLGAKGNTDKQLQTILGINSLSESHTPKEFHIWMKKILNNFKQNSDDMTLHFADKICFQKGIPIQDEFQSALSYTYSTQFTHYDFTGNKLKICDEINEWIKQQTFGKITQLLTPAIIESDTIFVLITAIYMKAKWSKQFLPQRTKPHPFHSDNQIFEVEMMEQKATFKYTNNPSLKCQMLQLPYFNDAFCMYIIIPENLSEFESEFTGVNIMELINSLNNSYVNVKIPKFDVEATYPLENTLSTLGINELFSLESANLSGISSTNKMYLSSFIHKCILHVTEVGTEAAATSAVLARNARSLVIGDIIEFVADRPFLYFIKDSSSGFILFFGKFSQPKNIHFAKKTEL